MHPLYAYPAKALKKKISGPLLCETNAFRLSARIDILFFPCYDGREMACVQTEEKDMKRIVAWLTAVCLTLLPVSAFAAETVGEGELIFSQTEELSRKVPFETVKALCEGGGNYLDRYGVTRKKLVAELSAHEHDRFYLGTPCIGGDFQSPNGDTSYNGCAGMNCAGFVSYVLRKAGMNAGAVMTDMRKAGAASTWGSPLRYNLLAGASNYFSLVRGGGLKAYVFPNKGSLLKSGKCEKGDIILRYWTSYFDEDDEDNHMMIFWGANSAEDKVWHSADGINHIGKMWDGSRASFILIKFAPEAPSFPPVAGFVDVRETAWYAPAVKYVKENGLMAGTSAKTFEPGKPATRGQIVTILYQLAGRPKVETPYDFEDVPPGKWYSDAVNWAAESGIVAGYSDRLFGPGDNVSREDIAVILYQYCLFQGLDLLEADGDLSDYKDVSTVSGYALEAMEWANGAGLITGTGASLNPGDTATRAQIASILMRFHKLCSSSAA